MFARRTHSLLSDINRNLERLVEVLSHMADMQAPPLEKLEEEIQPGLYRATEEGAKEYRKDRQWREYLGRNSGRYDWRDRGSDAH